MRRIRAIPRGASKGTRGQGNGWGSSSGRRCKLQGVGTNGLSTTSNRCWQWRPLGHASVLSPCCSARFGNRAFPPRCPTTAPLLPPRFAPSPHLPLIWQRMSRTTKLARSCHIVCEVIYRARYFLTLSLPPPPTRPPLPRPSLRLKSSQQWEDIAIRAEESRAREASRQVSSVDGLYFVTSLSSTYIEVYDQ